jgi:mono/diheme cytochrome c family protein
LAAAAGSSDPHALFEQQCGACHGHAGQLARDALVVVGGQLRTRSSNLELGQFLRRHSRSLSEEGAAVLQDMFLRQIEFGGLFQERCRICHDRASQLARKELIIEGDRLRGRYSGRDIREFLLGHGRLTPEEAETVDRMLRWQLETAGPG